MNVNDYDIRPLESTSDVKAAQALQQQVWVGEPPVPYHQMQVQAKYGGVLLGAFAGQQLCGFVYGFAATGAGRDPWLHSHMLAVLSEHRDQRLGQALKWAQREQALELGYRRMTWTFDPLESRNAFLNLHRLGAFVDQYYVDYYGEMDDEINRGLPSDRLLADWRLDWPPVKDLASLFASGDKRNREDQGSIPAVATATGNPPVPGEVDMARDEQFLRVPVCAHIQRIKQLEGDAAIRWRLAVRQALQHYIQQGYKIVDFQPPGDTQVSHYVLRRTTSED